MGKRATQYRQEGNFSIVIITIISLCTIKPRKKNNGYTSSGCRFFGVIKKSNVK